MKKDNVPVVMKPVKTLKGLLVHPSDKQHEEDVTECVFHMQTMIKRFRFSYALMCVYRFSYYYLSHSYSI